jgi:hypothetical protein
MCYLASSDYCGVPLFQKHENAFIITTRRTHGISTSLRLRFFSSQGEQGHANKKIASSQEPRDFVSGFQVFSNDFEGELRAPEDEIKFRNVMTQQKAGLDVETAQDKAERNANKKKNKEELDAQTQKKEAERNARKGKRGVLSRFIHVVGLVVVIVRNSLHDFQNIYS